MKLDYFKNSVQQDTIKGIKKVSHRMEDIFNTYGQQRINIQDI